MTDDASAHDLATRYRDAFFARDVDAIMALVTPDFIFENVTGGERIEGADAARRHIAALHARWPDLTFDEPKGGIMGGDDHAVAEWTASDASRHRAAGRVGRDRPDPVRDGRICRNAVYSSAHAARTVDPG